MAGTAAGAADARPARRPREAERDVSFMISRGDPRRGLEQRGDETRRLEERKQGLGISCFDELFPSGRGAQHQPQTRDRKWWDL